MSYITKIHQIQYNSGFSGAAFGPSFGQSTPSLSLVSGRDTIIISIFWEAVTGSTYVLGPINTSAVGGSWTQLGSTLSSPTAGGRSIYSSVWLNSAPTSSGTITIRAVTGTGSSGIRASAIAASFSDIKTSVSFVETTSNSSAKPFGAASGIGLIDGAILTVVGASGVPGPGLWNSPTLNPTQAGYVSGFTSTRNFQTNPDDYITESSGNVSSLMMYASFGPANAYSPGSPGISPVGNFSGNFDGNILSRTFVMTSKSITIRSASGAPGPKGTSTLSGNLLKAMFGSIVGTSTASVYPLTDLHTTVAAISALTGTLNLRQNMNSTIFGASALLGSIAQNHALAGTIAATSSLSARPGQNILIDGVISAQGTLSAAATIPTNSNLDLLEMINADTALETPQIVLEWQFKDEIPDIARTLIRKSKYRFPEDETDGDLVLQEYYTTQDIRTQYADTNVDPEKTYYYSVFFDHKSPFSMDRDFERDIERLGTVASVVGGYSYAFREVISTTDDNPVVGTLAHDHVKPYSVEVRYKVSGVDQFAFDDGQGGFKSPNSGSINYVTGEYSINLDDAPDNATETVITYNYGVESFWILARDNQNNNTLWLYNTRKKLTTAKVVIEDVLTVPGEVADAVADFEISTGEDGNQYNIFDIVTSKRFLQIVIPVGVETATEEHVYSQWSLVGKLDVGYEVHGASVDRITAGGDKGVRIMDRYNKKAVLFEMDGTLSRTMNLSSLQGMLGEFTGIAYDTDNHRILIGNDKNIYGLDSAETSPGRADLLTIHPVRQILTADFALVIDKLVAVDQTFDLFEMYVYADKSASYVQMEEAYFPVSFLDAIYHFDEEEQGDEVQDSSGRGNNITLSNGVQQGVDGKFGKAVQFTITSHQVDMTDAAANFSRDSGFIQFWYKSPYTGYLPPLALPTTTLFTLDIDGTDGMDLLFTETGNVVLRQTRATVTHTITVSDLMPTLDDGRFHCFSLLWTRNATLDLVLDGTVVGSVALPNSAMAGATPAYMGLGDGGNGTLGVYDEFVMSGARKSINFRYNVTTVGNRCWANSGREYVDSDKFSFRNNLRKYFSDFVLSKDYNTSAIAPNATLPSGEVLFREDKSEMILGDLGRTARFFGLQLDRIVDKRDSLRDNLNPLTVEYEYLSGLGATIFANEFDDEWNVDKMRRYLEVIFSARKRVGAIDSFDRMTKFLGFSLYQPNGVPPFITSRLKFDSCVSELRPDTTFDTSIFDSRQPDYPLVKLLFTFFQRVAYSATASVNGLVLTDPNATFLTQAEVGSMIEIYDYNQPANNGQYLIAEILSATEVVLDRFVTETATGLAYTLSWQVPSADPYVQQLFYRFQKIKARWQQFQYKSVSIEADGEEDDMALRSTTASLEHKVEAEVTNPLGLVPDDIWVGQAGDAPKIYPNISWRVDIGDNIFVTADYPPGDHAVSLAATSPQEVDGDGTETELSFDTDPVFMDADFYAYTGPSANLYANLAGRFRVDGSAARVVGETLYSRKLRLYKNNDLIAETVNGDMITTEIDLVGEDRIQLRIVQETADDNPVDIPSATLTMRRVSVEEGYTETVRLVFFKNPT